MRRGQRKSSNGTGSSATPSPVRVAVRIRPPTPSEQLATTTLSQQCVSPSSSSSAAGSINNALQFHHENQTKTFTFDHVFTLESTQKAKALASLSRLQRVDVYTTALQPLLTPFLNGFNVTVLAYGQTGSGKTYTVGNKTSSTPVASPARPDEPGGREPKPHKLGDEDGLLPRFLCDLFASLRQEPSVKTTHVSFLEIYCDEVRDLLQTRSGSQHPYTTTRDSQLAIREDEHKVWVENLRQLQVENVQKALELLNLGRSRQVVSYNAINDTSSRSHAIYTMEVARKFVNEIKKTKLTFVDLAGSERLKKTQVEGVRMKESIQINVGLLALGNVINALGDDKSQKRRSSLKGTEVAVAVETPFVPYRSSKLTRLLRDSLGGNSMTLFIACVSPSEVHGSETLNTLQYANRARNIQNKAEKNVESLGSGGSSPRNASLPRNAKRLQRSASEIEINLLQEQICFLKQQLDQANAAVAAANVIGTNIPSLLQMSPRYRRKSNGVRASELVATDSSAVTTTGDPLLELPLPVIPVRTKVSGIKPPNRSKMRIPMSPKTRARTSSSVDVVTVDMVESMAITTESNIELGEDGSTQIETSQVDSPVGPVVVAEVVTAIEATCSSTSMILSGDVSTEMSSSVEPWTSQQEFEVALGMTPAIQSGNTSAEISLDSLEPNTILQESEINGESPLSAVTGNVNNSSVQGADVLAATYFVSLETAIHDVCSPHEASMAPIVPLEPAILTSSSPPESNASTQSNANDSLAADNPCAQDMEAEAISPSGSDPVAVIEEDACIEQICCEKSSAYADKELVIEETSSQLDFPQAPVIESREEASAVEARDESNGQRECIQQDTQMCDEKQLNSNRHSEDRFANVESQNQIEAHTLVTRIDDEPEFQSTCEIPDVLADADADADADEMIFFPVGTLSESDSSNEFGPFSPSSPESSPVSRFATINYAVVDDDTVEVNNYESSTWKVSYLSVLHEDSVGNQDPADETYQDGKFDEPQKENVPQMDDTDPAVEFPTTSEPDFVLHRPPPCQALVLPRAHHRRGRLSPQKLSLRPMSIFDFADSWDQLQRSRSSSVSNLEALVKSTRQLIVEEFGESSKQEDDDEEDQDETHRASDSSAADRCLRIMAAYFAKRRKSKQRIAKLKHKLHEFEAMLGFPGPIYGESELCAFVSRHKELFLQQRVDFCEAIAAQRVLKRLQSRQEANVDLFSNRNTNDTVEGRIFLSTDQFDACGEWRSAKLHDRAYFQAHVLPLVLNGWIAITPAELEREDAWLAL